jgi:hypothetical protein
MPLINDATSEPVWWMKIILATLFFTGVAAIIGSAATFGVPQTALAILGLPAALIVLADAFWGV